MKRKRKILICWRLACRCRQCNKMLHINSVNLISNTRWFYKHNPLHLVTNHFMIEERCQNFDNKHCNIDIIQSLGHTVRCVCAEKSAQWMEWTAAAVQSAVTRPFKNYFNFFIACFGFFFSAEFCCSHPTHLAHTHTLTGVEQPSVQFNTFHIVDAIRKNASWFFFILHISPASPFPFRFTKTFLSDFSRFHNFIVHF